MSRAESTIETGVSFGAAMAMILSYSTNSSIWWMILHGLLGWLYVFYRMIW